jgi:hypothetical protein
MLPILRIVPVGGVLLAIVILVLAFNPPGGTHVLLAPPAVRGALMARSDHPEWRQFLMLAATRRAGEIARLRDLLDAPGHAGKPRRGSEVAGLPIDRTSADPDDATGSIPTPAESTLPMEIGEPSSTELPVTKNEELPPAITPARLKTQGESRSRTVRRKRHARAQVKTLNLNADPFIPNIQSNNGRIRNQSTLGINNFAVPVTVNEPIMNFQ